MDFIERMFGVSPDGGTGSTELMIVAVVVLVVLVIGRKRMLRIRFPRQPASSPRVL